jgi:hypothetical protein
VPRIFCNLDHGCGGRALVRPIPADRWPLQCPAEAADVDEKIRNEHGQFREKQVIRLRLAVIVAAGTPSKDPAASIEFSEKGEVGAARYPVSSRLSSLGPSRTPRRRGRWQERADWSVQMARGGCTKICLTCEVAHTLAV